MERFSAAFAAPREKAFSRARSGSMSTASGIVELPALFVVATRGSARLLDCFDLESCGVQGLVVCTYHLLLRPGVSRIEEAGGLHEFMGWSGPLLSDSGGFQVVSLEGRSDDEGMRFRSVYDGTPHVLTPEQSVRIQVAMGADLIVAMDDRCRLPASRSALEAVVERTIRWAERSREAFDALGERPTALVGVVQGGNDLDLRAKCAEALVKIGFDAYAVGGLQELGSTEERLAVLDLLGSVLPEDKPRYVMGLADPPTLVEAVGLGFDLFDSVLPTRLGRHGTALTGSGRLNLRAAATASADEPVDPRCSCPVCSRHSRSYIRHLLTVGEETGRRMVSLHNLYFMTRLFEEMRRALAEGTFDRFREKIVAVWCKGG